MLKGAVRNLMMPQQANMPGVITPQAKNIEVNTRNGNASIAMQQGATVQIYDSIPLIGQNVLNFFVDANSRQFPLTNLNQGSGKLQAGESVVMVTAQLLFVTIDPDTGEITATAPLSDVLNFQQGEIDLQIGQQIVLQNMKLQTWVSNYNKNALVDNYNVFHFSTMQVIMPQVKIQASVRLPVGVNIADTYAQLIIEGPGSLLGSLGNL